MQEPTDIFVSYARPDAALAGQMVAALEGSGWRVFWDKKIPTGRRWRNEIKNQLEAAGAVLVLWSPASVQSDQVLAEAESARRRHSYFPVRIQETEIPQNLGEYEYMDLLRWDGKPDAGNFPRLREDLDSFLRDRPAAARPLADNGRQAQEQPPADDLRSAVDRALAKTVNRGEQIGDVEALLAPSEEGRGPDRFCFLVEGCVADWAQALADHLRLRRLPLWPGAVAGDAASWEATPVRLMGHGREAFERALLDKIAARDIRDLHARIDSGELEIVFAELGPEERTSTVSDVIGGVLNLLDRLPRFAPGRRLVVLLGCSWLKERPPWYRRLWLDRRLRPLQERGCHRLERLGRIHAIHLGNWVNGFTEELQRRYDCDRLRDGLDRICLGDARLSHRELKPALEAALRNARTPYST